MGEPVAFQPIRRLRWNYPHPDKSADGLFYASGFALTSLKESSRVGMTQSGVIDILPMPTSSLSMGIPKINDLGVSASFRGFFATAFPSAHADQVLHSSDCNCVSRSQQASSVDVPVVGVPHLGQSHSRHSTATIQ